MTGETIERVATSTLLGWYEQMAVIRGTEKAAHDLFMRGLVKGTTHLAAGHEAVAVGASAALRPDDYVFATYRGHHHAIARGASPEGCLAELMQRSTGVCKAKGGSMHLTQADHGMLGSYAIVGAHLPMANGAAWSAKLRGTTQVAVAFFGDGATNIGAFHEALNLAAVWKLPVLFVCENNRYMEYTPIASVTSVPNPAADRAAANGMPGVLVDGNDVVAVHDTMAEAVDRARSGGGPTVVEALTYRHFGHSRTDPATYRPGRGGRGVDGPRPVDRRRAHGCSSSAPTEADVDAADARAAEIGGRGLAGRAGRARRRPGRGVHRRLGGRRVGMADLTTYRDAVADGIARELRRDPTVVCLGEDIGTAGGVFKTTVGLFEEFGAERVWDTPISEQAIMGAAMGAAMTGMRPVAEIMFSDFLACCWDYLANEIPKARYMTGGQVTVPLVVRTANGGGLGFGAQHSQSVENWALTVPGLKIAAPSTPADVVGLMASAIRSDDPVVFFEHKGLFASKGEAAPPGHVVPLGEARVAREGSDVTVVALAATVPLALAAAAELAGEGISLEVVDLRCLIPLDMATVFRSLEKTSRLIVVEENPYQGGWGATVASIVADEGFEMLDAPVRRVAGENVPLPFADALEQRVIPTVDKLVEAVRRLASY